MDSANTQPAQPSPGQIVRRWDPIAAAERATEQEHGDGVEVQAEDNTPPAFLQTVLVVTAEDCSRYRDDPSRLAIAHYDKYSDTESAAEVSTALISDIVLNDEYYSHLARMLRTKASHLFRVVYPIGNDIGGGISMSLATAAKAMQQLTASGAFDGIPAAAERVTAIADLTSMERMRSDYHGKTYRATIEGALRELPADKLVGLLLSDDDDFQRFVKTGEGFDVPKEQVAYALINFVRGNDLLSYYTVPDSVLSRFKALASYEQVDFQSIGKLTATDENEPARQAVMSDELHDAILQDMPAGLSDLERAMYIYIKMCRILSYDPEYYAVDQKGPATHRFQNIARVGTITPENNRLVCFEFNALLEKMLEELDIPYETKYGEASKPDQWAINAGYYGEGHEYCECRIGNYIVAFDSVTSILGGDLSSAKLGQGLQGVICRNKNGQTQQQFREAAARAYRYAALPDAQEQSPPTDDEAFRSAVATYREIAQTAEDASISFGDRMARWTGALTHQRLEPMDALSYALLLRRACFTENQRRDNFSLTIVRENNEGDTSTAPIMVLAVNQQGFTASSAQNEYFILRPQGEMIQISLDELRRRFSDRRYEYLEGTGERVVPGVALTEEPNVE